MIMYFAMIAYVPFAQSGCRSYLNWYPDPESTWSFFAFYNYGQALYATTIVSLVGWVS